MRRGRAPSRELSGSGGPQWDDPNGQLPGTGIPGDTGDSLYRSSSLRRRRDASPVTGTVESVGQEGVGVVPGFQNDPVYFRLQEVLLSIHFQQLYLL